MVHEFIMIETARLNAALMTGHALSASSEYPSERPNINFDLANYRRQRYGDTAIGSSTPLISTSGGACVATVR
jgi:hypothetical protein